MTVRRTLFLSSLKATNIKHVSKASVLLSENAIHTICPVINVQFPFKSQLKNHLFWKIPLECPPNTFNSSPAFPSLCCRHIQCWIPCSVLYFITSHICIFPKTTRNFRLCCFPLCISEGWPMFHKNAGPHILLVSRGSQDNKL